MSSTEPTEDEKKVFGDNLRAAMEEAGLTQADLALATGKGVNVVNTWVNGHRSPRGMVPWLIHQVLVQRLGSRGHAVFAGLWGDPVELPASGGTRVYTEQEFRDEAYRLAQEAVALGFMQKYEDE